MLERLGRQTLPVHKLLVMNTRSKTDVEKMLEGRPGIQTVSLEKEEFDHGGTRDRAARLSDADYLLFLTRTRFRRMNIWWNGFFPLFRINV